jgi:hypothetical protein
VEDVKSLAEELFQTFGLEYSGWSSQSVVPGPDFQVELERWQTVVEQQEQQEQLDFDTVAPTAVQASTGPHACNRPAINH